MKTANTIGFSRMVLHFCLPMLRLIADTIGFSRMVLSSTYSQGTEDAGHQSALAAWFFTSTYLEGAVL